MKRDDFNLPKGIYLDGNSLGPMPHLARAAVERRLRQWAQEGVNAWEDWFDLPERLSPHLARLVGAKPEEVIATGTTTTNLHALLASLYTPKGDRKHLVAASLDFPSDLYALKAWTERHDAELRLIPSRDGYTLETEDVLAALSEDVAIVWLPTVLYRSGQLLDVGGVTAAARERGVLAGWGAAHSIGAVPHSFHDDAVDFAVWCSYKYLNAGPGAPGGLFIHERHHHLKPALPGWWGHDKDSQFEMKPDFTPAATASKYQISTPSILAMAALEGALEVFEDVDMTAVRQRSLELTGRLMALADAHLPEMTTRTPREPERRGGHVALEHEDAKLLSLALRERNITPDYRPEKLLRLAPVALYNTEGELEETVEALRKLLDSGTYKDLKADARVG